MCAKELKRNHFTNLAEDFRFIGHREKAHLHWGEPKREIARSALHKNTKKPFDGPENGPMHHDWLFAATLFKRHNQKKN
jgi:hypothetical protein